MLKYFLYSCCFFSISLLQAQEIELSTSETKVFKDKVSATAQQSKTIVNTFVQLKHIDFLSNDIESSGDLYFKSPNIIKWAYTKPYEYSVIFKDKKLYINDAGKKSDVNLASNKVFKKLNDLIAKSVSGDMLDDTQFGMTFYKADKFYIAKLSPKDQTLKDMFKQIVLSFGTEDFLVSSVKLIEPSEDYTLINFKNKSLNQPIPDAVFTN
ncbi:outer membrane lipoprotein carrier protein LolA [Aquimarina sp. 2201CG14-23]|uniref:outer membrane lipoprotein carrier protein LolA n=1 Tax=Aquimarina mycalae TaxID=3040073 RepID=UPI00247821BF|nr:outer membrane lipoprotein carrier protein LolA [Aquimarina sp. 2201CG14-23]MDH7446735.1 outer membrane lipoprotein carrier protein LolA [Aquimarina sp. 2201CG14-23]